MGSPLVAGRYSLDHEIGRGGFGVVYAATDLALGGVVAIKRPHRPEGAGLGAARREAHALRVLAMPGVVRFLDEGEDALGPFLVTEYVDGEPFPGAAGANALLERASQLLEILARVHAAGILHGDLKPANVLVDRQGHVHVLDFGIARSLPLGGDGGGTEEAGTPRYLAPEQLGGGPVDARTDLYAVGSMLYESLTGSVPFGGEPGGNSLHARLWRDPRPVSEQAPDAPPALAQVVDQLVARLPARRPGSAAQALQSLGRGVPSPRLRMVGRDAERGRLLSAAREGRALDVRGAPGLGRSRLLAEVADQLAAERQVVRLDGAEEPLRSLRTSLGLPLRWGSAQVAAAAQARLDEGAVLVVDGGVDVATRAVIAGLRGAILGAGSDAIVLEPLPEVAQRELFRGPDKVLHLREDGARELHRHAHGVPARMMEVLAEWIDTGLAQIDGARLRLSAETLARLAERPVRARGAGGAPAQSGDDALLRWVVLGDGEVGIPQLAAAWGRSAAHTRRSLEALVAAGLVDVDGERVRARAGAEASLAGWTEPARMKAHLALAEVLATGTRARLRHLIQGGEPETVAVEGRACATVLAAEGRFDAACRALEHALGASRARVRVEDERGLLRDYVLAAYVAEDVSQRVLAAEALRRSDPERLGNELLLDLAEAAVALARRHYSVAEGLLSDLDELPDEGLEIARVTMLVEARTRPDLLGATAEIASWSAWASRSPERSGRWLGWRGLVAYRLGRFEEAAELHGRAAELRKDAYGVLAARLNHALSLLDGGRLSESVAIAEQLVEVSARARIPAVEERAWWILRSARYRLGLPMDHDPDLVEAAAAGGAAANTATVLNEAVIAWRAGEASAATLLARAHALYPADSPGWAMTVALRAVLGARDADELARARAVPLAPRLRAQFTALVGPDPLDPAELAAALAATPDTPLPRLEILSGREIHDRLDPRREGTWPNSAS